MANSTLHRHSRHIWVYMKQFTLTDLFCPHNRLRGWYRYLPCKTEKTKVHRDRILSSLLFFIVLYCLPGENYSLITKLSKSPQSIYVSCNSLEKEMATHSSILAWRIPWTEEPSRLQSTGLQRVRHDWVCPVILNAPQFHRKFSKEIVTFEMMSSFSTAKLNL